MLLKFKLSGAGELDGLYEVERFLTTRELVQYRKAVGLSPAELQEVMSEGGVEQLPMFAWACQMRKGRADLAAAVLDLPYDLWGGMETDEEPEVEEDPSEDPLSDASA